MQRKGKIDLSCFAKMLFILFAFSSLPILKAECLWQGHCLNAPCSTDDDCSGLLACGSNKLCAISENAPANPGDDCVANYECGGGLQCHHHICVTESPSSSFIVLLNQKNDIRLDPSLPQPAVTTDPTPILADISELSQIWISSSSSDLPPASLENEFQMEFDTTDSEAVVPLVGGDSSTFTFTTDETSTFLPSDSSLSTTISSTLLTKTNTLVSHSNTPNSESQVSQTLATLTLQDPKIWIPIGIICCFISVLVFMIIYKMQTRKRNENTKTIGHITMPIKSPNMYTSNLKDEKMASRLYSLENNNQEDDPSWQISDSIIVSSDESELLKYSNCYKLDPMYANFKNEKRGFEKAIHAKKDTYPSLPSADCQENTENTFKGMCINFISRYYAWKKSKDGRFSNDSLESGGFFPERDYLNALDRKQERSI